MNFTTTLVLGAFLLAIWCDTRLESRRPATTGWRVVHVAASCIILQVAAIGAGQLMPEGAGVGRALIAVFAILLPVFVYTFVAGLWLLRTLAELGFARR
jgi:hypothetical protein